MTKTKKKRVRLDLVIKQNSRCYWCSEYVASPTIDHLIPKSRGGTSAESNLALTCHSCNTRKSSRTPEEYIIQRLKEFEKFVKSQGFREYRARQ